MRILGGVLKGREIRAPKTRDTRPITSLLRKSIFDSLQMYIADASVLDLFAGSGAIGLEAISRGATNVVFVDTGRLPIEAIKTNIRQFQIEDKCQVFSMDAFLFLKKYRGNSFDLVFIDPPYPFGVDGYGKIIQALVASSCLQESTRIFLEAPGQIKEEIRKLLPKEWEIIKEKTSSTTHLFHLKTHLTQSSIASCIT